MTPYPVKIAMAAAWVLVAWWLSRRSIPRSLGCCAAASVLLAHVCALAGMWTQREWFRGPAMEGAVVPYIGFVGGVVGGVLLGIVSGIAWNRNELFYWAAHIGAIALLLLFPLYEW